MKSTKKYFRAFTLVELIIVITILSVLATIAFVSFSNYTKTARDSSRLSTLTNIEKGLIAYQVTTGKYPVPDNAITISDSGITIGQQGVIGESVSNLLKISKVPTDPQDGTNYVYSKNESGNKYQLMTFLESQQQTAFFKPTYADFSTRFPAVQGDNLGIFLDSNQTPVKVNIDVRNYSGTTLTTYFPNNQKLSGTGETLKTLISNYKGGKTWRELDLNCDIDDIVIGNQIWAGCNSTLGNGVERGKKDDGTDGIIGNCYSYNYSSDINKCPIAVVGNEMYSSGKENTWTATAGVAGRVGNIWGKFYNWNNSKSACPIGWHIPSDNEWEILEIYLNNGVNCRNATDGWALCSGLGWKNTGINTRKLVDILKIPLSGFRHFDTETFRYRGDSAYLWAGSSIGYASVHSRMLNWNYDTIGRSTPNTSYAFSVRCIKD